MHAGLRIHKVPVRHPACAHKAVGKSCWRGLSPLWAAAGDARSRSTSATSRTPTCPECAARSGKLSTKDSLQDSLNAVVRAVL